jgi:hypothetical protein
MNLFYFSYFDEGFTKKSNFFLLLSSATHYLTAPLTLGLLLITRNQKKSHLTAAAAAAAILLFPTYQLLNYASSAEGTLLTFSFSPLNSLWFLNGILDRIGVSNYLGLIPAGVVLAVFMREGSSFFLKSFSIGLLIIATLLSFMSGDIVELKFFTPITTLMPLYLSTFWEEVRSRLFLSVLTIYITYLWLAPHSGLLNFEYREEWEDNLKFIAENQRIKELTICLREKKILPNHFSYYQKYLNLKIKVNYSYCRNDSISNVQSSSHAIMALKRSSIWSSPPKDWKLQKSSRRIKVFYED